MPLIQGKSPSSFSKNVSTEMREGKPLNQSLAIAYAMKKKAREHEMATGGEMCAYGHPMAEGGFVEEEKDSGYRSMPEESEKRDEPAMREDDRMLNQHGQDEIGPRGMDEDNESEPDRIVDHAVENQGFPMEEEDMVSRIMKQREEHYSEGGQVANDSDPIADSEPAEFDYLVNNDDLDSHYTGANSGDEIGNQTLDDEMHDIVSRIMRSRAKRDRMPVPA
jgi:hypothetical protein